MERKCIEAIVAFIMLLWSIINYMIYDDKFSLGWASFFPLTIGAIIQVIFAMFMTLP